MSERSAITRTSLPSMASRSLAGPRSVTGSDRGHNADAVFTGEVFVAEMRCLDVFDVMLPLLIESVTLVIPLKLLIPSGTGMS